VVRTDHGAVIHCRHREHPRGRSHLSLASFHRDVDVLEDLARDDALGGVGKFDNIVTGLAVVTAPEKVGKREWFGELACSHQEPRAIDRPSFFWRHSNSPLGEGSDVQFRVFCFKHEVSKFQSFEVSEFHEASFGRMKPRTAHHYEVQVAIRCLVGT